MQTRKPTTLGPSLSSPKRRGAGSRRAAETPFQPSVGAHAAISVGLADVRREPDAASELVTQARLWTPACCLELAPGWVRVRLPDYDGWVRATEVDAPGRPSRQVAVVARYHDVPIFADPWSDVEVESAYIGTVLPLASIQPPKPSERLAVRLPGARIGWVARSVEAPRPREQPFPPLGAIAAVSAAAPMMGVRYLWGGTSPRGIDCSGFSQLCWRVAGATIPRDADQQYAAIPYVVARGDLRPGDLLFFATNGRIDHVALSFGGDWFIHATGSVMRVTMNSLDPTANDYSPLLARMYAGARRPMPEMPDMPVWPWARYRASDKEVR